MIPIDVRCKKCDHVWEVIKEKIMDDFILGKCPKCNSTKVKRIWCIGAVDVAQGILGNSSNNFTKGITNHPSKFGKFSGIKIK